MKKIFKTLSLTLGPLALLLLVLLCRQSSAQINPSYQQFNTNHFETNATPWKIAIKTNQNLTVFNLTVVSNAFFGDIFYATNIVNFISNINVAVNAFVSNSVYVTSNLFVSNNIYVTSNIFLGGTNIVELIRTDSLWGTNAASAQGGITNTGVAPYTGVHIGVGRFTVGGVGPLDPNAAINSSGSAFFADGDLQITTSGSLDGNTNYWIDGFDGSASFGANFPYDSNYFQVVALLEGTNVTTASPEFEVGYDGVIYIAEGAIKLSKNIDGSGVINILGPEGSLSWGGGNSFLSGTGGLDLFGGIVAIANTANGSIVDANIGPDVPVLGTDGSSRIVASTFNFGQMYEYTNTSPTAEGVFPTSSNLPALAYKRDGTDISYTWDTVVFTWR